MHAKQIWRHETSKRVRRYRNYRRNNSQESRHTCRGCNEMLGAVAGSETRWDGRLQSKLNASTSPLCAAIPSVSILFCPRERTRPSIRLDRLSLAVRLDIRVCQGYMTARLLL